MLVKKDGRPWEAHLTLGARGFSLVVSAGPRVAVTPSALACGVTGLHVSYRKQRKFPHRCSVRPGA